MKRALWGFLCLSFLLVGCFDKKELEEQGYVIGIGLDKGADDTSSTQLNITFQIANPEVGSAITGGGSNEQPQQTVTLQANDILTAINAANSFVSRQISVDHTQIIVVSEELARTEQFLRIMQSVTRSSELRRGVQIIVSKEKASEFLINNDPTLETRPHKYFQLMLNRARETGIIPKGDVHRFFQLTEGDADLFLAIYATTIVDKKKENGFEDEYIAGEIPQLIGDRTQFMGSAVFKEGKMIDVIDGQETRLALILDHTSKLEDILATYPDPIDSNQRIATRFIKKKKNKVDITYRKNGPSDVSITVPFEIEVLAVPSLVNYSTEENKEKLRKSIEGNLNQKARELVQKTQEQYGTEPFYWSLYVRKNFLSIKDYEAANWNKNIYPHANVHVNFTLKKIRFGKLVKNSNLNEVRD
ncbi:Ger(x)C family spore germination protein [Bacillus weihaiensis]|uniref:Uncharacterized protein n=1 Tax=Bacillus weihaiensis TaxID=1547283 RepID=A0A1L3MUW8_9BACI|nr:Ger(x)C family spore germination protein [Bacillus weihaiensis]APH06123.1 hypothetical protein A9C19_16005 [Bacillus weihaiensis]